jgi:hypothetical protein
LCYVDIYELAGDSVSSALLDDLQSATDRWAGIVNDRQDVLAKRQLLVVSDRQDTSSYCAETA